MSARYEELTGKGDFDNAELSIHPDDRDSVTTTGRESVASGKPFAVSCRLRMKDGSYRFMRVRAAPQRDEDGRVLRWYGVTEDVHEQEKAELAQRDVEERYRLAAQATNDAVWDHDFVEGVIDWSDNAAAILGAAMSSSGRTLDSWWTDRIHPDEKLSLAAQPQGRDRRRRQQMVRHLSLPPRRRLLCRRPRPRLHHSRLRAAKRSARSARSRT